MVYISKTSLPRYIIDGDMITYKKSVYAVRNYPSEIDSNNIGKLVGIDVRKDSKRKLDEFIFAVWVRE